MYAGLSAVIRGFRRASVPIERWMSPRYRYGRPPATVVRWARLRTVGSVVVVVAAGTTYPSVEALHSLIGRPFTSFVLAVPALVAAGLVLLLLTPRGRRAATARELSRIGGKALLVAAGWAAWLAAVAGMVPPRPMLEAIADVNILLAFAVWIMVNGFVGLVVVPVTLFASCLALRHWFAGADVHPMLPAMCAAAFGAAQLVLFGVDGLDAGRPVWVDVLLGLGGPLVVVGFAAIELWLVSRSGVSPRAVPRRW